MKDLKTHLIKTSDNQFVLECPDCNYQNRLDFVSEQGYCRRCKHTFKLDIA